MRYSTIEKECLAMVWALQFFHVYLYRRSFTIETDHQPLAWLQRMKNTNPRITRWAVAIQPYCFSVAHRKGTANNNAAMGCHVELSPLIKGMIARLF